MTSPLPSVTQLVAAVDAVEHTDLDRVRAAVVLADDLGTLGDEVVNHFVEAARRAGCSWSQIGAQLGVSKQAAQQAFVAPLGRRRGRGGRSWPPRRMSEAARAVLAAAGEEASGLGHDHIGTEHLLLALCEGAGLAAAALRSLGVDQEAVRGFVVEIVGRGEGGSGRRPFSPRAKKVLELALRESIRLHQGSIGTEHLLLGILREGEGVAPQILADRLGLDLKVVRQTVIDLLHSPSGDSPAG